MQTATESVTPARFRHRLPLDRARRLEVVAARVSAWVGDPFTGAGHDRLERALRWARRVGVKVGEN
jgi:hypothetical protein